jgi:hypothetical protein
VYSLAAFPHSLRSGYASASSATEDCLVIAVSANLHANRNATNDFHKRLAVSSVNIEARSAKRPPASLAAFLCLASCCVVRRHSEIVAL